MVPEIDWTKIVVTFIKSFFGFLSRKSRSRRSNGDFSQLRSNAREPLEFYFSRGSLYQYLNFKFNNNMNCSEVQALAVTGSSVDPCGRRLRMDFPQRLANVAAAPLNGARNGRAIGRTSSTALINVNRENNLTDCNDALAYSYWN